MTTQPVSLGRGNQLGAWLAGALTCALLVALAYEFVDRPVALFVHAHGHGTSGFNWLTYIPEPFVPIACFGLLYVFLERAGGRPMSWFGDAVLRCSLSVLAATAIKDQLKYVFGRTWPETWIGDNPSFIADGVYGFNPFHGGAGWASFPSGHTAAIFSVASALWLLWPRLRLLWALGCALVMIGLIGADFHFVSDIIAGAYLGTACGVTAALLGRRELS